MNIIDGMHIVAAPLEVLSIHDAPTVIPPAFEPVAITALTFHAGACCSECDGSGLIDTGSDRGGRAEHETCAKCGVESFGEVTSRGQRCGGVFGESCADGIYAAHLTDGAFELPSGELICRACAAVAVGYRGLDDAIDLGILTALELVEGGAL
jgi:Zn ribbon nucleic-acid-binding protein